MKDKFIGSLLFFFLFFFLSTWQSLLEQIMFYSITLLPQHLIKFLAHSKHLTNTQGLKEERKICTYTKYKTRQNYMRMLLAVSYRIINYKWLK